MDLADLIAIQRSGSSAALTEWKNYFSDGPPPDFDGDGDVDLADLMAIQRSGSAPALAKWKNSFKDGHSADFDRDGDVDVADLLAIQRSGTVQDLIDWKACFNTGCSPLPGTLAVPEPGASVAASILACALATRRWQAGPQDALGRD